MAKIKIELTEKEIKEAILAWAFQSMDHPPNFKNVTLNAAQSRDAFDRPGYGHTITAEVSE